MEGKARPLLRSWLHTPCCPDEAELSPGRSRGQVGSLGPPSTTPPRPATPRHFLDGANVRGWQRQKRLPTTRAAQQRSATAHIFAPAQERKERAPAGAGLEGRGTEVDKPGGSRSAKAEPCADHAMNPLPPPTSPAALIMAGSPPESNNIRHAHVGPVPCSRHVSSRGPHRPGPAPVPPTRPQTAGTFTPERPYTE